MLVHRSLVMIKKAPAIMAYDIRRRNNEHIKTFKWPSTDEFDAFTKNHFDIRIKSLSVHFIQVFRGLDHDIEQPSADADQ